jgi:hypothetical protein
MLAVLCAAICSCTKENPVPTDESVPLPWRVSGVTPQTSTYTPTKAVDCQHYPYKPVGGSGCTKDTVVVPPPEKKDSCCR